MYPFECGRNWLGGLAPPAWWCWACRPAPRWTWYRPPPADADAMGPPRGMTMPPPAPTPPRSVEGTQRASSPPSPSLRRSPGDPSDDAPSDWDEDEADDADPTREMDRKDRAPAMDDSDVDDVDSDVDGGDGSPGPRDSWTAAPGGLYDPDLRRTPLRTRFFPLFAAGGPAGC
mmetsp:Transcript_19586/g.44841  ORF Transcript_19586/g.44841 Transcript_19586/m.44841 type:complete len:173 (-) Transcript_19586:1011-1529(-)